MKHQRMVLLLAAVLFLWWLGGRDLWAPNEPYFAEGAREMVVDGEWAVPHVNGVMTTDKPPLFFWLIALVSLPFGQVTLWTSRLPSVFAALGTVAITMRLGQRFYGPKTAALAEGIYQALVTTVAGLLVAIPCLATFAVFRNRVDQLVAEAAYQAQHVFAPLKRRRTKTKAASTQKPGGAGPIPPPPPTN